MFSLYMSYCGTEKYLSDFEDMDSLVAYVNEYIAKNSAIMSPEMSYISLKGYDIIDYGANNVYFIIKPKEDN